MTRTTASSWCRCWCRSLGFRLRGSKACLIGSALGPVAVGSIRDDVSRACCCGSLALLLFPVPVVVGSWLYILRASLTYVVLLLHVPFGCCFLSFLFIFAGLFSIFVFVFSFSYLCCMTSRCRPFFTQICLDYLPPRGGYEDWQLRVGTAQHFGHGIFAVRISEM